MAKRYVPSPMLLRKLMRYCPDTGRLWWRERTPDLFNDGRHSAEHICANWNSHWANKEAFTSYTNKGYRNGLIFGTAYKAHRVIWALHYGEWPAEQIDHVNGIRDDNRLVNLRDVTNQDNCQNQKRPKNNTSGTVGVSWHKSTQKWVARITVSGRRISLGYFEDKDDASAVRQAAEVKYGFSPNHGRE